MRKNYYLVMSLAAVAALSSCKKLGELSADNFTVTPTPLEAIAGQVPATIDGKYEEESRGNGDSGIEVRRRRG